MAFVESNEFVQSMGAHGPFELSAKTSVGIDELLKEVARVVYV